MAKITFYGGAGSVTGASFLLDTGDKRILIDCGALEREHVCDTENAKPFAYDPSSIDALIVTHAHQDHIGRVPKLVRDGFKGVIYSTPATRDLSELMFEDAIGIMRSEATHEGCPIMYEKADADLAFSLWKTHDYHEPFEIGDATFELLDAGHILGSAMVRIKRGGRSIIFTGDLGNSPEPLLNDTESPRGANYLVMESVYGDRVHEDRADRNEILKRAVEMTAKRNGTLLIPSFSLERTQILLFEIGELFERGEIPKVPVYLDSPLAERATEIFRKYTMLLNPPARERFEDGKDGFSFPGLEIVRDVQHSHKIHAAPNPKLIIAGAGMSSGGRIRAHEERYLPEKDAAVLFVGYQAPGSLGRRIQEGQKEISIDGKKIRVRATVGSLTGYSGHKDRDALLEFVESAGETLERVFVVMGEPKAELFLAQRIRDFLGVDAQAPQTNETVEIDL